MNVSCCNCMVVIQVVATKKKGKMKSTLSNARYFYVFIHHLTSLSFSAPSLPLACSLARPFSHPLTQPSSDQRINL